MSRWEVILGYLWEMQIFVILGIGAVIVGVAKLIELIKHRSK